MAKGFQFSLQKLLDIRQLIEDSRAVALRKSRQVLEDNRYVLMGLQTKKESALEDTATRDRKPVALSLNQLRVAMDHIYQLNSMIYSQDNLVRESESVVERDHDELVSASKDKKIVEKLRENQRVNFKKNNTKKALKTESEIALSAIANRKAQR